MGQENLKRQFRKEESEEGQRRSWSPSQKEETHWKGLAAIQNYQGMSPCLKGRKHGYRGTEVLKKNRRVTFRGYRKKEGKSGGHQNFL